MPSNISWTDETWNPVTGCSPISEGCAHCYAATMAKRLQGMGRRGYERGFEVTLQGHRIYDPMGWRKPRRVFTCSMGDLFHENVGLWDIAAIFNVMHATARDKGHTFFVLTKRPQRMKEFVEWWSKGPGLYGNGKQWPSPDIWLGVTAENQKRADERIPILLQTPAAHRFVSVEPMLGPVDIEMFAGSASRMCPACGLKYGHDRDIGGTGCNGIEWVICGGESGPGHRKMEPAWAGNLQYQCELDRVPFHFKQHSGPRPGWKPELDGVRYKAMPPFRGGEE